MTEEELGRAIENLMVARNLRGMKQVQAALQPGYYLRAARYLRDITGTVLIGTGFPVANSFETDGPVGAIALYQLLEQQGARPILVCGPPLSRILREEYAVQEITLADPGDPRQTTAAMLKNLQPCAVISIERPGLSATGRYFNMRGEDISELCACFDFFLELADCPTIAIGDGGNEIGMGNIIEALAGLDITPAVTRCNELLVADVSNWAVYGLIAIIGYWRQQDLLARIVPRDILGYLSARGSVDGVTRANTLTEDGLPVEAGEAIIEALRDLTNCGDSR